MQKSGEGIVTTAKRVCALIIVGLFACESPDPVSLTEEEELPEETEELVCGPEPSGTATNQSAHCVTPGGIWVDREFLVSLSPSGPAWESLMIPARHPCTEVSLTAQASLINVCILGKSIVFATTGDEQILQDVVGALEQVAAAPNEFLERALVLGQNLPAYVIAADLVELSAREPALDARFRDKLRELLTMFTHSGPTSLVDCHETRPNNWGTHCGAARAAVAAYLEDEAELARVAEVFRGWLGEPQGHADFRFGDLWWQCDSLQPMAVNPAGCSREGVSLDGVLPDDQRRAGPFTWPPPKENYVWEALGGALVQATILTRAGYPAFTWGSSALLRATRWLHDVAEYPAEGDDTWQPHLLNHHYGTDFPAPTPSEPGKNIGWTEWTHPF